MSAVIIPLPTAAAQSTLDALAWSFATYGLAAFAREENDRRLADLSDPQLEELIRRLDRVRDKRPAVTDELLARLAELLP